MEGGRSRGGEEEGKIVKWAEWVMGMAESVSPFHTRYPAWSLLVWRVLVNEERRQILIWYLYSLVASLLQHNTYLVCNTFYSISSSFCLFVVVFLVGFFLTETDCVTHFDGGKKAKMLFQDWTAPAVTNKMDFQVRYTHQNTPQSLRGGRQITGSLLRLRVPEASDCISIIPQGASQAMTSGLRGFGTWRKKRKKEGEHHFRQSEQGKKCTCDVEEVQWKSIVAVESVWTWFNIDVGC